MLQATGYPAEIADFYSAISAGYWGVFLVAKTVRLVMLVYKHKKKLLAEEKATNITPDEPTELENLLDMIIALEESGEAE